MTSEALFWVRNCAVLNRAKGSLRVLYRSTLMAKRLKTEMGMVIRYTTCQIIQNASPWFHSKSILKSNSISNGITMIAARKSERARDRMKRSVGLLRRCLLASIARQTNKFPNTATDVIAVAQAETGYENVCSKMHGVYSSWGKLTAELLFIFTWRFQRLGFLGELEQTSRAASQWFCDNTASRGSYATTFPFWILDYFTQFDTSDGNKLNIWSINNISNSIGLFNRDNWVLAEFTTFVIIFSNVSISVWSDIGWVTEAIIGKTCTAVI